MTEKADSRQNCFFCNAQLVVSTRNGFNIFKTVIYPIERKASDLISDVLDIPVTENAVHSEIVCKKCFKLVNEFADLETRAAEIRTDLTNSYNATRQALEEMEEVVEGTIVEKTEDDEEGTQITFDAERLNQLVAEGGANSLSELLLEAEAGNGTKLLLVNDGEYEEVEFSAVLGGKSDEGEGEEEDDDDLEDNSAERLHESEAASEILEQVGNLHVCRLCPIDGENRPFSCETKSLSLMIVHLKHDHQVRFFLCDICGAGFKKRTELNAHLDYHVAQEDGDYQCDVCSRVFSNLRLYRIHKRLHQAQNKAWSCEICMKKYSSRNLLEEHRNSHTGIRPYVCQSCGKSFSSKYTFKAHMKTHEARERNYVCRQCDKTFLSPQNLQQHVKTHSDSKDYVCDICGKGFGSLRNLEVHSVVHSGIKPFVCVTCGKAFARKAEIKDHERTHTGERPFQCEHCGAQFSQRSNLQSHRRVTHYNDRRYLCGDCGKGFKRRRLLDYHMKAVHTGERPYQCATCDASFVYPEHYKKHIRIHTGLKPYKCEVCEKAFNSRDNRNAHRFVHSDKKPYECLVCGLGFMRKPLLYNHMQQAGHINDTIVVNQPRLEKDDGTIVTTDADGDIELTIVDEAALRSKKKLYLTDFSEHVIIQGDEVAKFADGSLRNLHSDDEEQFDEMTMTASFNEQGQLVNEEGEIIGEGGQIITQEGHTLIVDEMDCENGDNIIIKTEDDQDSIQYVQIRVPESTDDPKSWLNMVKNDDSID